FLFTVVHPHIKQAQADTPQRRGGLTRSSLSSPRGLAKPSSDRPPAPGWLRRRVPGRRRGGVGGGRAAGESLVSRLRHRQRRREVPPVHGETRFAFVDVFAEHPLAGNPLALVPSTA